MINMVLNIAMPNFKKGATLSLSDNNDGIGFQDGYLKCIASNNIIIDVHINNLRIIHKRMRYKITMTETDKGLRYIYGLSRNGKKAIRICLSKSSSVEEIPEVPWMF